MLNRKSKIIKENLISILMLHIFIDGSKKERLDLSVQAVDDWSNHILSANQLSFNDVSITARGYNIVDNILFLLDDEDYTSLNISDILA